MGLQPVHMGKDSVTLLTWTKILGKPTILVYIYIYSIGFILGNLTQPPSSAEFLLHLFYVATTLWWKEDSVARLPQGLTAPQLVSSAPQFASELQWQNLHRQTSVFTGFRWKAVPRKWAQHRQGRDVCNAWELRFVWFFGYLQFVYLSNFNL